MQTLDEILVEAMGKDIADAVDRVIDTIHFLVVDLMKPTHIFNLIILKLTNNPISHGLA